MIMAKSDFFKISILMLCIEAKCAELVIGVACGQASPAMAGPLFLGFIQILWSSTIGPDQMHNSN